MGSNQDPRSRSSNYNSLCYWNVNVIWSIVVQITYLCLLPLFGNVFESLHAIFLFGTTLGVPGAFLRSKNFLILNVWISMGVGRMTVRVSSFWLQAAVSMASPTLSACTTAFGDAKSHFWQLDMFIKKDKFLKVLWYFMLVLTILSKTE